MLRAGMIAVLLMAVAAIPARADFGPAFDVATATGSYEEVGVAVDAAGNAHFVWQFGTSGVIQTRTRSADGTLGPIQDLSSAGRVGNDPHVAVDGAGNAFFVWEDRQDGEGDAIRMRRRAADGTLGPVRDLATVDFNGFTLSNPDLAVDGAGNVVFVWTVNHAFDEFTALQARRLGADGTLGPVETLSPAEAGEHASGPRIAMAPDGDADLVWVQSQNNTHRIVGRRRAAGGALGPMDTVSLGGNIGGSVVVAVDDDGNAHVAWAETSGATIFRSRVRSADGTLGEPVEIGVDGQFADVDVDAEGNAYFAFRSTGPTVRARRRAAGGGMDAVTDDLGNGTRPRVAVGAAGDAHFVWQESPAVKARSRTRSGTLGPVQTLAATGGEPAVDANASGVTVAAWPGAAVRAAVAQSPIAVIIGSGPSGLTNSSSARFEFVTSDPTPPPGRFECRLDGGAFTPCASPLTLSGLAEGEHALQVRYHADGEPPGGASERRWTVDTVAPTVAFDSTPGDQPNATIAWAASEPATFTCRLDNGPEIDCESPHNLFGLAPGPHAFTVTAFDLAGNASQPASTGWSVGGEPPPPQTFACPAGGDSAGFGPIRLVARAPDACFVNGVSRGRVTLNGIALVPASGTRIFVEPRLGDGRVRSDGPVTIEFGTGISRTVSRLNLNGLASGGNVVNRVLGLGGASFSIAGLEVELSAGLEFKADNGGQVTVSFAVKLPDVFRALPGAPRPPTIQFAPTFSNDKGLTVAGKLKLETVYLFGVTVKNLELGFDSATGVFEGGLGIELGPSLRGVKPTLSGSIAVGPTNEPCGLRKLSLQASNLNRHISHGVFLQRLGGTFECIPQGANVSIRLSANAGVSLGPRVSVNDVAIELVSVDGTVSLSIPVRGNAPLKLGIEGVGKIIDVPIATSNVTYTAPARIDMSGQIDLTFGGYGAQFGYGENVFISPDAFNLEARGFVNLFGLRYEAETVFSSRGFAVCLGEPGEKVGFGKRWGGDLATFALCDVGPFRAQASQAGERTVAVDGMTVIAARGSGAPPKIVVTGPGERIETPAGPEPLRRDGVLLVQDPERNTTFVVLFKPRKGRYTVSGAQSVSVAEALPPLKVRASVRRGVLRWRATGLAGQRLELVEHANGLANRILVTRRASGRIRLKPDPALSARRRIEAIAYNGATPRASVTVARYRAALPRKPGRVRGVKLRRGVLSWRAVRGAVRYELALTAADGTTRTVTTRRTRLRARPRAVAIVAFNAAGKPGPITRNRLQ